MLPNVESICQVFKVSPWMLFLKFIGQFIAIFETGKALIPYLIKSWLWIERIFLGMLRM